MPVTPPASTPTSPSDLDVDRPPGDAGGAILAGTDRFTILAIDDNPSDLEILRRLVRRISDWKAELTTCTEAMDGLALLERDPVDVVLVDYRLGAINGIQLLELIRRTGFEGAIIVLTGQGDERLAAEALRSGAADYMPKSDLSVASLRRIVDNALEKSRLQLALKAHRERLERANEDLRLKNQEIQGFYHTLSHELKTPLTAAREFVSILLDGLGGPLSTTQIEYLGYVKEGCDQMRVCLDDILDVTRVETGRFSVRATPQPLHPIVHRAVAGFSSRARAAGIQLESSLEPRLPDAVIDSHRITQVVGNLIDNGLKFTDRGGRVAIEVRRRPETADRIEVSVSDTGKGIPEEHLPHIFERLYQIPDGSEPSRMGLGLGLFICREIVRLHGGELSVTSRPGTGSAFRFTLPVAMERPTTPWPGNHGAP
jgi:signal transduction histidine kinase